MSRDHRGSPLAICRADVAERLEAGESFRAVEHAIGTIGYLTEDEKVALWLFAFLRGDPLGSNARQGYSAPASIREGAR